MASSRLRGDAAEAWTKFEECRASHDEFAKLTERRYEAYRAIVEEDAEAARWTHKLFPPYAQHIIETTLASLVDDKIRFRVRPRPKLYEPGELDRLRQGAKAFEILLDWQLDVDRFGEKQRTFVLQNLIAGLTVAKCSWRTSSRMRKKLVWQQELVNHPETGMPVGFLPRMVETEEPESLYDGPETEIVNVQDFFWDDAAVSLEKCPLVAHRVWMTFDELKQTQKRRRDQNRPGYEKVDELKESKDFTGENQYAYGRNLFNSDRTKDRIEVVEIWKRDDEGIRVFTIANRTVLLEDRRHPYWHGDHPFIGCSTQPDLFRIPGMSQVEKIEALQKALWSVGNQRLDNLELVNLAIAMFRSDVDDPDAFDFFPGARWILDDPTQVQMWTPNVVPAQVSLGAESLLKADMQNLASTFPFTSGSEADTVDQKTATGASIVTSLAQRAIAAQKTQLNYAYQRIGQQFMELDQQFVRDPVLVQIVGADNEIEFQEIVPEMLQGGFVFDITPMTESMMRAERRAESTAALQMFLQAAQVFAVMGIPLAGRAFMEDWLDSYNKYDHDRYFTAQPQPAALQPGQQPGQEPSPNGQPMGVTGPQSIDPAVSPSTQTSLSGEQFLQRALAMRGGPNNAPRP